MSKALLAGKIDNTKPILVDYFDDFSTDLKKYNLNSYLKSVNTH